ncbi:MAG: hypothetical protein HRT74_00905 [Flavobacteriales bacterium]|nr:hypothetical protein [Flavobacteriales bacterium]
MADNPFKIIEPREQLPEDVKNEVMGSVKSVVLLLRFIQLFVGDYTTVFLDKFKTNSDDSENSNLQS